MNQATMDSLFNENKRVSTTGTAGEKGTELGSILIKDFVDSINGELSVDSQLEKGTVFTITIPKTN